MVSLQAEASLIVAAFDLLKVRAVTNAIRAADIASGDVVTAAGFVEKPAPPPGSGPKPSPAVITPEPVIEPRRHLHPTPFYEKRPVLHPTPRIIESCERPVCVPCEPTQSAPNVNPIEPPWKVLPWMDRYPRAQRTVLVERVKIVAARPDIFNKGMMVDLIV